MGKLYPELDERLRKFIARQSVFFVATAPCLTSDGRWRACQRLPEGLPGHLRGARADRGGLPGPDRQRRRDDRAPAPERPDNDHVLLIRPHGRRSCGCTGPARSCCRASRDGTSWPAHFPRVSGGGRPRRARQHGARQRAVDHRRRRAPDRRLLRLRRARDGAEGGARRAGPIQRRRSPPTSSPPTGPRRTPSASTALPALPSVPAPDPRSESAAPVEVPQQADLGAVVHLLVDELGEDPVHAATPRPSWSAPAGPGQRR